MKVWCGGRVMPRFGVGVGSCLTLPSTLALTNPTRAHKAPVNAHLVSCTLLLYEGGELESSETFPSSSSTMIEASVPEVCLATVRVSVSHAAGSATSGRPRGRKVAGALLSGWYNVRSATRNLARGPTEARRGSGAVALHSGALHGARGLRFELAGAAPSLGAVWFAHQPQLEQRVKGLPDVDELRHKYLLVCIFREIRLCVHHHIERSTTRGTRQCSS